MKSVGDFNKVSEKLVSELIPNFKNRQTISFRLLNGQLDIPTGKVVFGASRAIRLSDTIFDPYAKKDSKDGAYIDIGVPKEVKEGRVVSCKKYIVESPSPGIPGNGVFTFTWGNVDDMQIVEFLLLSNHNVNNPHRDTSKEELWEYIDVAAEAKKEAISGEQLDEALALFLSMKENDILAYAEANGMDTSLPPEAIKNNLRKSVNAAPAEFLQKSKNKKKKTEVTV